MKISWTDAVWRAVQRQAALRGVVTRADLIAFELGQIIADTGSRGVTPEQTLSRVLQELRDTGTLIFDGSGRYRPSDAAAKLDVSTAIATEALRLQSVRLGQNSFRAALDSRWQGACPLTGIGQRELLRASHIVPWNRCESDAERLDPDNGLLLSALWDAAFDRGMASFDDEGRAMFAANLDRRTASVLSSQATLRIEGLSPRHRLRLGRHRAMHAYRNLVVV